MARAPRPTKANAASVNPNTKSLEWQSMSYKWWLMATCWSGTASMRDAGQILLPKHQGESILRYNDRLQSAVFTNYVRLTVEFLVGKPFSEKVVFRDGTPQSLLDLESDVDGTGNDLTTVCMDFFQRGYKGGHSWLMIDYPSVMNPDNVTLADKDKLNLRPYWIVMNGDEVLDADGALIEGKFCYTHMRVSKSIIVKDGYSQSIVRQIWEYNLKDQNVDPDPNHEPDYRVVVTIHQEEKPNNDKWTIVSNTVTTGTRITAVRFNSAPDGDMTLEDLLYQNVAHWQSTADQKACLVMARFPILAAAGVDDDKTYVIGSYELLRSSDPLSKFYYVENNGTAIGVGSKDIESIETHIAMYGATMLKKKPDRQSATSATLDEAQNMAPLQIMVLQFMSAMEQVCDYTLLWLNDPAATDDKTYGVNVNLDFALSEEQQKQMSFIENARLQGDISRIQYFTMAIELGYIPSSFPIALNQTQIEAEQAADQANQLAIASAKGAQGNNGSGTGDPLNNPNDPKITKKNVPAV
jgi:hypothetical protein